MIRRLWRAVAAALRAWRDGPDFDEFEPYEVAPGRRSLSDPPAAVAGRRWRSLSD